ncbi:MAG: hypothetical protein HRT45_06440 [Bdellovibrionales bacterium]|nr:hypothetical protein [Bdellovibrionales bacterium]
MKLSKLIASTVIAGTVGAGQAFAAPAKGELMFAKNLKQQICKVAAQDYGRQGVKLDSCIGEPFVFTEDAQTVSIDGGRQITTVMDVAFSTGGIDFDAKLVAKLMVTDSGRVTREGWELRRLNPVNFSDENILKNSWYGEHVKHFDPSGLDEGLMAKVRRLMVDEIFIYTQDFENEDDFSFDDGTEDEWKVIEHPESGKVLGYIVPGWAESEEGDIKMSVDVKITAEGEMVTSSVESWGYHE